MVVPDSYLRSASIAALMGRPRAARARPHVGDGLALAPALGAVVLRYLLTVRAQATRELAHWQAQAQRIPDPVLRRLALDALAKRGNMEGAALMAVLSPRAHRRATVRALVAFQAAYNYLDILAEQPSEEPTGNGLQLHQALLVALDPAASHPDYYASCSQREDGGYLVAMVDACRTAFAGLPSHGAAADAAHAAAVRIVGFQSLNLTESQGGQGALSLWAGEQAPAGSGLQWWQTAASCGSSLAVHVLIALAASPSLDPREIAAVEDAYFPWIGALHSLLDSLVDISEDELHGQRNLLGHDASIDDAAARMRSLTRRCADAAGALPRGPEHSVILTMMAGHYLSAPEASVPRAEAIAGDVADALGALVRPTLALFKARRLYAAVAQGKRR
jgi:tetraprenyl-beta-curcumene synthase